jgi:hypothetical protein
LELELKASDSELPIVVIIDPPGRLPISCKPYRKGFLKRSFTILNKTLIFEIYYLPL